MKIKVILTAAAILIAASCTKPSLPQVNLLSSTDKVEVQSYSSKIAFSLQWELSGGNTDITKTYVQFSNDKEFINPYVVSSSEPSYLLTFRDIKTLNDPFGTVKDYVLYVRVLVEGEGSSSVYSNKIHIDIVLP
ncbi:MAG: hypothetical protein ACI39U_03465 [Candidatus Cryptobacteroides sp.]